jgi:magnesium transporter
MAEIPGPVLQADQPAAKPSVGAAVLQSRAYRSGRLVAEGFPFGELSEWIKYPDAAVWMDLADPTPELFGHLSDELGLHVLAVEDVEQQRQRPKLDRYENHLLLSAYCVALGEDRSLNSSPVFAFVTEKAVVTVHPGGHFDPAAVAARLDDSADLAGEGVGFIVYGLLDLIVDGYFAALQDLDDDLEALSDQIFDLSGKTETADALRRSFDLRRSLLTARRVITPMREVVNTVMRRDLHIITPGLTPYYQDLYDHALRAADWTDNLRDLISTVRETYLTIQGNRMNLIMKKVTSWAAIIAVPAAVTGYYGQNLPYPGFQSTAGYWTSTGIIVVACIGLYIAFRRRDWL